MARTAGLATVLTAFFALVAFLPFVGFFVALLAFFVGVRVVFFTALFAAFFALDFFLDFLALRAMSQYPPCEMSVFAPRSQYGNDLQRARQ
jgi:hypothetical protein